MGLNESTWAARTQDKMSLPMLMLCFLASFSSTGDL